MTGANLQGANLSQVKCKKIVGAHKVAIGAEEPDRGVWEDVLLAISRYQNSDWATNQIVANFGEGSAPVLAFYDTSAEQDVITKRLCAYFGDASHVRAGFSNLPTGINLLWFYSKANKEKFRLNPASLDSAFFELLRVGNTSDDIVVYPFRSNQMAIERIRNSVQGNSYYLMRKEFARSLRKELAGDYGGVVLFSGYPPMSKQLYQEIRDAGRKRLKLIFLCSSNLESFYNASNGVPWRRVAIPAYSIGEPLAAPEDITRLIRRVGVASGGTITISKNTEALLNQYVGKPLVQLKKQLAYRIKDATKTAASRSVPVVSFVL